MQLVFSNRRIAAFATTLILAAAPAWSADTFTAKVRDVSDGDTLVISRKGRAVVVQLDGIDAPELSQEYGREARAFVREATKGKKVSIEVIEETRRNSLIVRISVDGKDLAATLVATGLAWATDDPTSPELEAAQKKAMQAQEGLWAKADPTPPWTHRASA